MVNTAFRLFKQLPKTRFNTILSIHPKPFCTNINIPDKYGRTLLSKAAIDGKLEEIKSLVKEGAHLNPQDMNGCTPIYLAAQFGQAEAIELLYALGANIHTPDTDGKTPFCIAAQFNHSAALKVLYEAEESNKFKPGSW